MGSWSQVIAEVGIRSHGGIRSWRTWFEFLSTDRNRARSAAPNELEKMWLVDGSSSSLCFWTTRVLSYHWPRLGPTTLGWLRQECHGSCCRDNVEGRVCALSNQRACRDQELDARIVSTWSAAFRSSLSVTPKMFMAFTPVNWQKIDYVFLRLLGLHAAGG